MADHRKIAVCQDGKGKLVPVTCHRCKEANVFDLYEQLETIETGSVNAKPGVIFCRSCALSEKSYDEKDWKPVIDCHHDVLSCCVSDSIVPVSLSGESSLKVSKAQVSKEAKKWIVEEFGIRGLQVKTQTSLQSQFHVIASFEVLSLMCCAANDNVVLELKITRLKSPANPN